MKKDTSRRKILQGLSACTILVGFDIVNGSWVGSASTADSFVKLPHLDGVLYTDDTTRANAANDDAAIARMLDDNRRLFDRNRDLKGTRYPVDAIQFSQEDWQQHFGSVWNKLVHAKQRYDPDNVLTPGLSIFTIS